MKKNICIYGIFFSLLFVISNSAKPPKIIGLVPVRNENIFITQCLKALSLHTDAIVVLDDCSTDNTVDIIESLAKECRVKKIIRKTQWYRDEPGDRNALLLAGRELGGTHFIVIDADEMLTANCLKNNYLKKTILSLNPGDQLALNWIQLWRSPNQYRHDSSVWTNNYRYCIFCDDGTSDYGSLFIHAPRVPADLKGRRLKIEGYKYGLLHFEFVHWRNLLIKQAWYRCLEHIRTPEKSVTDINKGYGITKDERNMRLKSAPSKWFSRYTFFDPSIFNKPELWREEQILGWFNEYGRNYFADLDIWDIDWGNYGE